MTKQERIARRIVASIYSWYVIEDGKAYAFLDKHSRPCYYVAKLAKNSYRVIKFDSAKFSSQEGRGKFNAILVSLKVGNDKMLKAFGECIKSDRRISAGKAVAPLLRELGMTLPEFENLFRTETDFTSGDGLDEKKYREWRLVFEKGTREPKQVLRLLDKIDKMLGGFSKALSYGIVEIKNDLPPRVLADYNPKNDSMRVKSTTSDGRIYHSFIHELAHRLWFKRMSKAQRNEVNEKYEEMKHAPRKRHVFQTGETIELKDGCVFEVVAVDSVSLTANIIKSGMETSVSEGETYVFSNAFDDDDIMRVNDELFDNGDDMFPSEYSRTSVEEFFSECFAYWRAHELCRSLSSFMKDVFTIKK